MSRLALLCGLTLALLAGPAFVAGQDDPEPPYRTKRYGSPNACFNAYAAASKKKDYKTAIDCLAPEAQKDMAAFTVYTMLYLKGNVPDEFKKAFKPVFDVMDKHGLTDKALKDFKAEGNVMKMPEKTRTGLRKLIKKPAALLIEMGAAQEKAQKDGGLPAAPDAKVTLSPLNIKGDKATGTIITSFGGNEVKQSVEFVKLSVGWKMIPSLELPIPDAPAEKKK